MKRILLFFSVTIINAATIAQSVNVNVYTPNGCLVGGTYTTSETSPSSDFIYWQNELANEYSSAVVIEEPSRRYNCHGYAWHMTEGGNPVQMVHPSEYWNSGSFIETTAVYPGKVDYWGSNHSAVTTLVPDHFISKWGLWGPVVSHHKDHCPYDDYGELIYYKKNPDIISGPDVINSSATYTINACQAPSWTVSPVSSFNITSNGFSVQVTPKAFNGQSGTITATINGATFSKTIRAENVSISGPNIVCYGAGSTFTVTGAPTGYEWDKSPNLTLTGSGNSVTISKTDPSNCNGCNGTGWVSVKYNGEELLKKIVWVGPPAIFVTPTETAVTPGEHRTFYANVTNSLSAPSQYEWILNKAGDITYYTIIYNLKVFDFANAGNYQVHCRAYNTCGYGEYDIIDLTAGYWNYSSNLYPNPASNILNIEVNAVSAVQSTNQAMRSKADPAYDIRLYDGQGNLLRYTATRGGKVEFNVANLTNGIYYLHIYDGVNEKPEIRQIVVSH